MKKMVALVLCISLAIVTVFANKIDNVSNNVTKKIIKNSDGGSVEKREEAERKAKFDEGIALIVDGTEISREEFNYVYVAMYDSAYQYYNFYAGNSSNWLNTKVEGKGITVKEDLKKSTIDYLVDTTVICNLAKEYGITVNAEFETGKSKYKQAMIEEFGGEDQYKEGLERGRTTEDAYMEFVKKNLLIEKCYRVMQEEGGAAFVTDAEAKSGFEKKYYRAQHILISTQSTYDENGNLAQGRSDEDAKALASEIIKKLDGGANFENLVKEYGEDPGMISNDYYTFTDGNMVKEFENATKALKVGEYTKKAVKTSFGYHIIKRYETIAEGIEFENYKLQLGNEKTEKIVAERIDKAEVFVNDEKLDPYIEKWLKELEKTPPMLPGVYEEDIPEETADEEEDIPEEIPDVEEEALTDAENETEEEQKEEQTEEQPEKKNEVSGEKTKEPETKPAPAPEKQTTSSTENTSKDKPTESAPAPAPEPEPAPAPEKQTTSSTENTSKDKPTESAPAPAPAPESDKENGNGAGTEAKPSTSDEGTKTGEENQNQTN